MRFDTDIGGRSWFGYLFDRMEGLSDADVRAGGADGLARSRHSAQRADIAGDILNEFDAHRHAAAGHRPDRAGHICNTTRSGRPRSACTSKPVKIGSCCGQMIDRMAVNGFYKDRRDRCWLFPRR